MKKNRCRVNYKWVIMQNQKVILEAKSKQYQTCQIILLKKELEHATSIDTSDLAAKNILLQ